MKIVLGREALDVVRSLAVGGSLVDEFVRRTGVPELLAGSVLVTSAYLNEMKLRNLKPTRFWLDLLDEFGKDLLQLIIATDLVYHRRLNEQSSISKALAEAKPAIEKKIVQKFELDTLVLKGRGQNNAKELVTIGETAARKLLSVLFLEGDLPRIRQCLRDCMEPVFLSSGPMPFDSKTMLQEQAQRAKLGSPRYHLLQMTGPQHAPLFRSCVQVAQLRAEGNGSSKKASEQDAAWKLLQRLSVSTRSPPPRVVEEFNVRDHQIPEFQRGSIEKAEKAIGFSFKEPKLLSIALLHQSLVNELPRAGTYFSQRPLATLGAQVTRALLRLPVVQNPEQWWSRTVDSHSRVQSYAQSSAVLGAVARKFGFGGLVGMGKGQANALTESIEVESLQACLAAVFLDCDESLTEDRFTASPLYGDIVRRQTQIMGFADMVEVDPKTLLQEVTQLLALNTQYKIIEEGGPDHSRWFKAELILSDDISSYRFRGNRQPSKTDAEADACRLPLLIVDAFPKGPAVLGKLVDLRVAPVLGFLQLLTQCFIQIAEQGPPGWKVLADLEVFGANVLISGQHEEVRITLGCLWDILSLLSREAVREFKDALASCAIRAQTNVRDMLVDFVARISIWLDEYSIDSSVSIQKYPEYRDLIALSALGARTQRENIQPLPVNELYGLLSSLRGWSIDIKVEFDSDVKILGDLGTVVELVFVALRELESQASSVRISISDMGEQCCLSFVPSTPEWSWDERRLMVAKTLVPAIEIRPKGQRLEMICPKASQTSDEREKWVESVMLQLLYASKQSSSIPMPFAMAAHDLKNVILAIGNQIENARQSLTRRYQHLAAAEQALMNARVSARTMALMLKQLPVPSYERFSLSRFMKDFTAELIRRAPRSISIHATQDPDPVDIIADEILVYAALENLCKNAIEAMPSGGKLRLEWLHDHATGTVMLEVADTGSGIPNATLGAIEDGRPAPSTKPRGNGLGLLSVRHIARLHGGELTLKTGSTGTICILTLASALQRMPPHTGGDGEATGTTPIQRRT